MFTLYMLYEHTKHQMKTDLLELSTINDVKFVVSAVVMIVVVVVINDVMLLVTASSPLGQFRGGLGCSLA